MALLDSIIDSIISIESGGNPLARNPNSTAFGLGQFIESTWLDTLAKHRPDLVSRLSRQELLNLRANPDLSREMVAKLASDNAAALQRAGIEPTPGAIYLAHFAGPAGAIRVLRADSATPVESLLGSAAVTANPFLRGKTAADLIAWAERKMGGAPRQAVAASAAPSVAASAAPSVAASAAPSIAASVALPSKSVAAPAVPPNISAAAGIAGTAPIPTTNPARLPASPFTGVPVTPLPSLAELPASAAMPMLMPQRTSSGTTAAEQESPYLEFIRPQRRPINIAALIAMARARSRIR
jgi:hypothetical protein